MESEGGQKVQKVNRIWALVGRLNCQSDLELVSAISEYKTQNSNLNHEECLLKCEHDSKNLCANSVQLHLLETPNSIRILTDNFARIAP
jgi:hypothetical protein